MAEKPVCMICLNPCLTPAVLHLECSCKYTLVHYRCMKKWWKKNPVCIMCHTYCEAPEMLSKINNMSICQLAQRNCRLFVNKRCRRLADLLDIDYILHKKMYFLIYLFVLIVCSRLVGIMSHNKKNDANSAQIIAFNTYNFSGYL